MPRLWRACAFRRDSDLHAMNARSVTGRLLQIVPTVAGIVLIAFILIHASGADPVLAIAGEHGDAAYYDFMRHRFGLDRPLPAQLGTYFLRVAQGDLGYSYVYGRPTLQVIAERIPATLLLTGIALVIAVIIAIPLGVVAAQRAPGGADVAINTVALALYSTPTFWVAQLAILGVGLGLGWLPVQGMTSPDTATTVTSRSVDVARHLVLPALVLAAQELAVLVRLARTSLLDQLSRDHVRTARAKGVAEFMVVWRHALPQALVPALMVIGARIGHLVAGAVVVEIVFGWPGVGRLLLAALQARDTPILLGLFLVVAFSVVVVNLLTDLLHVAADPRLRAVSVR
jgi:peptide/nickel transport system permease protein